MNASRSDGVYMRGVKYHKQNINKVFLRAVTCAVMQKTGAGLHTANSCYWDTAMDGKQSSPLDRPYSLQVNESH